MQVYDGSSIYAIVLTFPFRSKDCTQELSTERVCYKCKQPGHVQSDCPN